MSLSSPSATVHAFQDIDFTIDPDLEDDDLAPIVGLAVSMALSLLLWCPLVWVGRHLLF